MWVGFDPPISAALRNFDATQCAKPEREAVVRPAPRTVADGGQNKLILGTSRAAQSEPTELQDALQVCEPHLDLFAPIACGAKLASENGATTLRYYQGTNYARAATPAVVGTAAAPNKVGPLVLRQPTEIIQGRFLRI